MVEESASSGNISSYFRVVILDIDILTRAKIRVFSLRNTRLLIEIQVDTDMLIIQPLVLNRNNN
ncbi:MAG: hypothetical protein ACI8RD_002851 [Bacillariaceae sp.]|jgi:hypothetical protein